MTKDIMIKQINIKIKGLLLALILSFAFAGGVQAAATIYSPTNYSSYTTGTNVYFYWTQASSYNYISIWNGSWGPWINRGSALWYGPITRSSDGWLGAQVATYESGAWQYSNIIWISFYTPPPPPPPPPVPGSPVLTSSPIGSAYQGDTVVFSWNSVPNATSYYILYRRDGVWNPSWIYTGLATSQSFITAGLSSEIAAQTAACNSSGCGYSNVAAVALSVRPPGQMGLTPLTSGNTYNRSFSSVGAVNYDKIVNSASEPQVYTIRIGSDSAQTAVSLVDADGNPSNSEMISLNDSYVIFKVAPGSERYASFRGQTVGSYSFAFNRFRNFPFFEGP
ncbi:MAG: hypothetical protein Q8L21_00300 [Candidatus Komeilibacteria bacterium]|nr:hypothetical protein [Candidatus Komeilibacteria bacterium]